MHRRVGASKHWGIGALGHRGMRAKVGALARGLAGLAANGRASYEAAVWLKKASIWRVTESMMKDDVCGHGHGGEQLQATW